MQYALKSTTVRQELYFKKTLKRNTKSEVKWSGIDSSGEIRQTMLEI